MIIYYAQLPFCRCGVCIVALWRKNIWGLWVGDCPEPRRSSCEREPPKNSPLRSLPHIFGHEVSVACDRSIYCSCGSYVSKGDIVGGVLRVFSHPARLVVRSPRQWRIRNNNDIHYVRCHRSDLEQISIRLIINMILSGFRKDIWMNVVTIETPGIFVLPAIQLLPT